VRPSCIDAARPPTRARQCKPSPIHTSSRNRLSNAKVMPENAGQGQFLTLHWTTPIAHLMARPLRLEFPCALFHLTARGNAQQAIFLDDGDRQHFLRLLGREVQQQQWRCYLYCLMGNHYHLLIETPEPNLSRGLKRLHGTYTQWFNRRHQRVGHLLQGRFKSLLVEKERDLLELCRDVVLNPVRAGMVREVGEWNWSSDRATAGLQEAPDWLDVPAVLSLFNDSVATARTAYRGFVADGVTNPHRGHM